MPPNFLSIFKTVYNNEHFNFQKDLDSKESYPPLNRKIHQKYARTKLLTAEVHVELQSKIIGTKG